MPVFHFLNPDVEHVVAMSFGTRVPQGKWPGRQRSGVDCQLPQSRRMHFMREPPGPFPLQRGLGSVDALVGVGEGHSAAMVGRQEESAQSGIIRKHGREEKQELAKNQAGRGAYSSNCSTLRD